MTATEAGEPAMDPDDAGPDVPGAGTEAAGAQTAGAQTAGAETQDDLGAPRFDGASLRERRIAALRGRLISPMPSDGIWGWAGPLLVTAFAGFLRFNRLSVPHAVIFDETYYAKDAWSILQHGVEWNMIPNPANNSNYVNDLMLHGSTHILAACDISCGEYVVQPPLGKLAMAVSEWMIGLTPLGWRVAPAVFGTLAVLIMCRIARRLTRSTLLGCAAGLLLSLDGLEYVLSRTGILDIFLMFFVLAAFGAMLIDRDVSRARLATIVGSRTVDSAGPWLGIRKWRVIAGLLLGLACACKQDAVWYLFAFMGLAIAWDVGARKAAGLRDPWTGGWIRDGVWLPLTLGLIPLLTYIATWSGWLITSTGYDRNYAQTQGVRVPVISALYSLFQYHRQMVEFGVGLHSPHPYMSQPWGWIVLSRPVAFYYTCYTSAAGTQVCPKGYSGQQWSQEVLALGNPAIWWVSIAAMLFCLGWWLTRRDWRAGAVLLCIAAGWFTWLPFMSRTKFDYYSLEFLPFLVLAITLCLGLIIGPAQARLRRRAIGAAIAGTYVLAVLILFWYFYPILAGQVIPYTSWLSHMWYHGWI
jgi:dolichyl-phosphate-mannose-protein mannosyltransferase